MLPGNQTTEKGGGDIEHPVQKLENKDDPALFGHEAAILILLSSDRHVSTDIKMM